MRPGQKRDRSSARHLGRRGGFGGDGWNWDLYQHLVKSGQSIFPGLYFLLYIAVALLLLLLPRPPLLVVMVIVMICIAHDDTHRTSLSPSGPGYPEPREVHSGRGSVELGGGVLL